MTKSPPAPPPPCTSEGLLACENIHFSSLFAAEDVSRGGRSSTRNVPSGEERGETDVFAAINLLKIRERVREKRQYLLPLIQIPMDLDCKTVRIFA